MSISRSVSIYRSMRYFIQVNVGFSWSIGQYIQVNVVLIQVNVVLYAGQCSSISSSMWQCIQVIWQLYRSMSYYMQVRLLLYLRTCRRRWCSSYCRSLPGCSSFKKQIAVKSELSISRSMSLSRSMSIYRSISISGQMRAYLDQCRFTYVNEGISRSMRVYLGQ